LIQVLILERGQGLWVHMLIKYYGLKNINRNWLSTQWKWLNFNTQRMISTKQLKTIKITTAYRTCA